MTQQEEKDFDEIYLKGLKEGFNENSQYLKDYQGATDFIIYTLAACLVGMCAIVGLYWLFT